MEIEITFDDPLLTSAVSKLRQRFDNEEFALRPQTTLTIIHWPETPNKISAVIRKLTKRLAFASTLEVHFRTLSVGRSNSNPNFPWEVFLVPETEPLQNSLAFIRSVALQTIEFSEPKEDEPSPTHWIAKDYCWQPRLTIGRFPTKQRAEKVLHSIQQKWTKTLTCHISHILCRTDKISQEIPLGTALAPSVHTVDSDLTDLPNKLTHFVTIPTYKFDCEAQEWIALSPAALANLPQPEPEQMRLTTWNVLNDMFNAELIHSDKRIPILLQILEQEEADIIILEEVTTLFVQLLQKEPWVQAHYFLSDIYSSSPSTVEGAPTVQPYGQVFPYPLSYLICLCSTKKDFDHKTHKSTPF